MSDQQNGFSATSSSADPAASQTNGAPDASMPKQAADDVAIASAHTAAADSSQDANVAKAAAAASPSADAQPQNGPGHDSDVQGLNGTGLASSVELANAPSSSEVAGQASHVPAAPPSLTQTEPTSASSANGPGTNAPGTGNPFDVKEEADVGAPPQQGPPEDEARPTAEAVAPKKESVLSPVEVDGQAQGSPSVLAPKSEVEDVKPSVQSSVAEPPSNVGVDAATAPTSPDAQPSVAPPASTDVVMEDAQGATVSSTVAPAVAGLGGADAAAAATSTNRPEEADEPPAKRQRMSPPTVPASQAPAAAVATSAQPVAFADSATIEMSAAQLKFAQNSIKSLKSRPESQAFLQPVDPEALNIPQYRQVITKPMDLGTVDIKLALTAAAAKGGKPSEKTKQAALWHLDPATDVYRSVEQWEADVRLVFANCIQFNGPDHLISQSAKTLQAVFDKQLKSLPPVEAPPPPPVATATAEGDKRGRRPSNPVPAIRRSSSDAGGRPKREIHPPAPRDLPYADEPQSASSGKKRKGSKALTLRQQNYYAKVAQDELKYCTKVVDELMKPTLHDVAWPFYDLVAKDLDFADAYYAMIKKPICLRQILERLRKGQYQDKGEFIADMNLLFSNAYTFNAPGTDVFIMAQKVEAAYQDRMKKMPQPRPLSPGPDEDEGDDDDSDDELAARIADLEEQLAQLRRQQATARSNKSAAAAKKKAAKAAAADASAKKKAAKSSSSSSKGSMSGGAGGDASSKKSKKKRMSTAEDGSDDEGGFRPVTWEQKEELAMKIGELPEDRLDGALKIISEDKPQSANAEEEIELDIDDLSPRILYKLYCWVVKPKRKPGPKPGTGKGTSSSSASHKKSTSGKKRKNLDEEQEAARIAALQEQLQSFDRGPEATATPSSGPAAPAAAAVHDDLVQSESSSGEEDSDASDSDY